MRLAPSLGISPPSAAYPMNDIERKRVENAVAAFVAKRRPPVHLRDQVDLSFRFDGRSFEIFELRPRWNNPAEKIEEAIAKARYLKSRNLWLEDLDTTPVEP